MIIFYAHGGSDNHGCEAIIRGTLANIKDQSIVYSGNPKADISYGLGDLCKIIPDSYKRYYHPIKWAWYKVLNKIFRKKIVFMLVNGKMKGSYLSVGGDNYCYPGLLPLVIHTNKRIRSNFNKTYLWGTSIEPELLENKQVLEDLNKYDFIFARESITYGALCKKGLKSKTFLFPDPAFAMMPKYSQLPQDAEGKKLVGINISPLIFKYEKGNNAVNEGYEKIINYILSETDYDILFVPHVVKKNNNDLSSIKQISRKYNSDRIYILNDRPADQLKYCISKCDFFIGARTHATIAAYSTCVPTMVVGYSVKANGIARDIFGTEKGFVSDVRAISTGDALYEDFINLFKVKNDIKKHLMNFMPTYIEKTLEAADFLMKHISIEKNR